MFRFLTALKSYKHKIVFKKNDAAVVLLTFNKRTSKRKRQTSWNCSVSGSNNKPSQIRIEEDAGVSCNNDVVRN